MPERRTLAAVDLGSNSFHMLVARLEHGQVQVIDRIREMVRLAAGLDDRGRLDEAVRERALQCLARFGERLRDVPRENIRAVGTQTFRRLRHPGTFLRAAERSLDCPIEIIGGREEARLIYSGVYSSIPRDQQQRLVIDIGGGSTELIIGDGPAPRLTESVQYGCVSVTQKYFADGKISSKRWHKARTALLSDLQELSENYRQTGWQQAVGCSGTIRAIRSVCTKAGWCDTGISRSALSQLIERLIDTTDSSALKLDGLSERRRPVFVGGVLILDALFSTLEITQMAVSDSALREGLLHDMLGRLAHDDPRNTTIQAMAARYGVDQAQAARVRDTALLLFDQVRQAWQLGDVQRELLIWTAEVHETGLGISHSHYQRHTGYLLHHSDMAGFSRLEQLFMALLGRYHRRSISNDWHEAMPRRLHQAAARTLCILRLAVILHRSRSPRGAPPLQATASGDKLNLFLPPDWREQHPLLKRDLKQESNALKTLDIQLNLEQQAQAIPTPAHNPIAQSGHG